MRTAPITVPMMVAVVFLSSKLGLFAMLIGIGFALDHHRRDLRRHGSAGD